MMQKALYFMPDISGFTKFVNNTEVEHSIHIIAELLEILLDNNPLNLQLVEIEGDALFMYLTTIPTYEALMKQVSTMHEAFHNHTQNYDNMRICNCGSCKTTTNLDLKFLVHYGDLNFIKVKHISKPYGRDVIKIHRLLKNKIPHSEYVLFTNSVYKLFENQLNNEWKQASEDYDLVSLDYFYKSLETIKDNLQKLSPLLAGQPNKPVLTIDKTFNANIEIIYSYLTELKYRHLWDKDVKRIEYDSSKVNRVGTEHNCVLNLGSLKFETITEPSSEHLTYGEKTKEMMFTQEFSYIIKLYKVDENITNIVLNIYITFSTIGSFMKNNILKLVAKLWNTKLEDLHEITKIQKSKIQKSKIINKNE
ncbi:MAG: DUF2652 domain-containing protein [Flavobacteriales bacterium]|nr:DUF2652 domain-containing protein [Flavobacteriia bacterium]NCP04905.1 DUF2652 domain-containing protein [Flavobacteriales bacterium]PIV95217.1 MAG: hypothetical protein COW44_00160 [Flavobacteriaceae bacterium CG17_big_fil_post_rev_8_21_14_2_50_33_15]PJB16952.1 MAG: hypothetical protein CO117_13470 [Flavobacteriaceae bacterium CG_4_9_14_3_um_filter_33_16]NCP51258.1 DUF2652 domain-containing protein [Flavobacteriales bacterium]